MKNNWLLFTTLLLVSIGSYLFSLSSGSVNIHWQDIQSALFTNQEQNLHTTIIHELRLPRSNSAFITGALLALSGALMQVLLRNPLADPYILGISGGAAVAALMSIIGGLSAYWVSANAFVGALFSMFLVFSLSHGKGSWTPTRLLLTGVVIASGWGAIISFLLSTSDTQQLQNMLFWLMGDLSHSQQAPWTSYLLLSGFIMAFLLARHLNLLARGETQALSLGLNVPKIRLFIYFLASLLTACAVTIAGSVGFVGLVIPHCIRLLGFSDHRLLLPCCILLGGSLLTIADTLARILFAPQQLPVGVVTAFIGVPVFLIILYKSHHGTTNN